MILIFFFWYFIDSHFHIFRLSFLILMPFFFVISSLVISNITSFLSPFVRYFLLYRHYASSPFIFSFFDAFFFLSVTSSSSSLIFHTPLFSMPLPLYWLIHCMITFLSHFISFSSPFSLFHFHGYIISYAFIFWLLLNIDYFHCYVYADERQRATPCAQERRAKICHAAAYAARKDARALAACLRRFVYAAALTMLRRAHYFIIFTPLMPFTICRCWCYAIYYAITMLIITLLMMLILLLFFAICCFTRRLMPRRAILFILFWLLFDAMLMPLLTLAARFTPCRFWCWCCRFLILLFIFDATLLILRWYYAFFFFAIRYAAYAADSISLSILILLITRWISIVTSLDICIE